MKTAKELGYKVVDEFGIDLSTIVSLEIENNKVVKVVNEFGNNIIKIVSVEKE